VPTKRNTQTSRLQDELVVTTTRLPRDLLDDFRAAAASEHRSVAAQLRLLVENYLEGE
jgi:hypothetical protein